MADKTRRAFACGHPISHSRSPLIHGYWLESLGLAGSYELVDVAPAALKSFLSDLEPNGFVGGNITLPHKQAAFALAEEADEAARLIGAVNTVWIEDGRLCATNTDATGFSANLDEQAPQWRKGRFAIILGAGGAARAVFYALRKAGIEKVGIVNRTAGTAFELARLFGGTATSHEWKDLPGLLEQADLLVNTTSLGMVGHAGLEIGLSPLRPHAIVADIVYVPLETSLLREARARGLATVDGLGMLLHQAVPGFARWFGVTPRVTSDLRARIVTDLEKRH